MSLIHKPLLWLHGEIKTSPFTDEARMEAGYMLKLLQMGMKLSLPASRPMSSIGARCHELRIRDKNLSWRIIYRIDTDAIVIIEVFEKKSRRTSQKIIEICKLRLKDYDSA